MDPAGSSRFSTGSSTRPSRTRHRRSRPGRPPEGDRPQDRRRDRPRRLPGRGPVHRTRSSRRISTSRKRPRSPSCTEPGLPEPVDYPVTPFGLFHIVGARVPGLPHPFPGHRPGRHPDRPVLPPTRITSTTPTSSSTRTTAWPPPSSARTRTSPRAARRARSSSTGASMDQPVAAFKKYVDGLLDLMLANPAVVDYYGKDVILFLGPDEGTADLMEWAALRARQRGYKFWKAFSTGKPVAMGGIPHDLYGMTTNSVHEYVLGSLGKLGLKEETITKVMTGGPDGDLGSNEILLSKDKSWPSSTARASSTTPRASTARSSCGWPRPGKWSSTSDRKLLSTERLLRPRQGHATSRCPDGEQRRERARVPEHVPSPSQFQRPTIFVPCGGRPSSININNWTDLARRQGPAPLQGHRRGRQPLHHPAGPAPARGEGRHPLQGRLGQQGRGHLVLARGPLRPGPDRRGVRGAHVSSGAAKVSDFRKAYVKEIVEHV